MKIGYARVSTVDQNEARQMDSLSFYHLLRYVMPPPEHLKLMLQDLQKG